MKKALSTLLACLMMLSMLMACATGLAESPEIVDGRFTETRQITVEVYDRGNDGGSTPENNFYTDFIKEGMLRDHNVEVTFVPNDMTDKEAYINGFDDRHLLYPGYKEGVRKLNEWYNDGLIWSEFALYGAGDTTEEGAVAPASAPTEKKRAKSVVTTLAFCCMISLK